VKFESSEILPYLYVGSCPGQFDVAALTALGVTHILTVRSGAYTEGETKFTCCHLPLSDLGESRLEEALERACAFIEKAQASGGKVLVHCGGGRNRSPTVATGYLMCSCGMRLKEAFYLVRSRRPEFAPHENYLRQLQELERTIYGSVSLNEDEEPLSIQAIARIVGGDERTLTLTQMENARASVRRAQ
jgi:protein-tyrosine phosphatase